MLDALLSYTSRQRARLIIRSLDPFLSQEKSVLDIGCGNGVVLREIQGVFGCRAVGTDILDYASGIDYRTMPSPYTLDFPDHSFDVGLLNDVLHHVPSGKQIVLVHEALRVCDEVFAFEAQPGLFTRIEDRVSNYLHNPEIPVPLTHRRREEWISMLKDYGIMAEFYPCAKRVPAVPLTNFLLRMRRA